MGLTVAEKEHWRERIASRLQKKIDRLYDSDPQLTSQMAELPKRRALKSLGLASFLDEIKKRKSDIEDLEREIESLQKDAVEQLTGDRPDHIYCGYGRTDLLPTDCDSSISKRVEVERVKMLESSEVGRQVLAIQEEQENLLDTVWLATSPKQIKELWDKLSSVVDEPLTPLQKQAQSIEPMDS